MKLVIIISQMLRNFKHAFVTTKKFILGDLSFSQVDIFFTDYPGKTGIDYCKKKLMKLYRPRLYNFQNRSLTK